MAPYRARLVSRKTGLEAFFYEGKILDGRNRFKAWLKAGMNPWVAQWGGVDPVAYVVSMNLRRRHLSESQRAGGGRETGRIATGPTPYPSGESIEQTPENTANADSSIELAGGTPAVTIPQAKRKDAEARGGKDAGTRSGERGAGSAERGPGSGERGAGTGERGAGSAERGARSEADGFTIRPLTTRPLTRLVTENPPANLGAVQFVAFLGVQVACYRRPTQLEK